MTKQLHYTYKYDIGATFVISNKTYIVKKIKDACVSYIRCKYCPFKYSNCSRGLCEALGLEYRFCQNIITLEGRIEPASNLYEWESVLRRKLK